MKSDEELRNDIKEFLSTVGLPQDHVPSTKELSQNGRQDLANIVRRRGYKFIRELIAFQMHKQNEKGKDLADDISLSSDSTEVAKQTEDFVGDVFLSSEATKGERNLNDFADDVLLSSEATEFKRQSEDLVEEDLSLSAEARTGEENTTGFVKDISLSSEATVVEMQIEDLVEDVSLSSEVMKGGENINDLAEDISLANKATQAGRIDDLVDDVSSSSEVIHDVENMNDMANYSTLSSEADEVERQTEDLAEDDGSLPYKASKDEEDVVNLAEDVSLFEATMSKDNTLNAEISREPKPDGHSYTGPKYSSTLSLHERVAKFIRDGELDDIEGSGLETLKRSPSVDSTEFTKSLDAIEIKSDSIHGMHEDLAFSGAGGSDLSNGHISCQPVEHPAHDTNASRAEILSNEKVMVVNQNEDIDAEAQTNTNQAEINRLKYILHQKEMELTKLKEQIEKEKHALFLLQSKAEKEISEAQKLISEKDAELHAAEESLSELKEVEIEYWGEGEIVEVAGSFNGWHQRIKMDPLPSSSISDLTGSRSRLWKTVLWLYPGVYEIKFISDGNWIIDSQRESVTRGGMHNNILRVDR